MPILFYNSTNVFALIGCMFSLHHKCSFSSTKMFVILRENIIVFASKSLCFHLLHSYFAKSLFSFVFGKMQVPVLSASFYTSNFYYYFWNVLKIARGFFVEIWNQQYKIHWFAGSLGQMTRQPNVWRSKHYFFNNF